MWLLVLRPIQITATPMQMLWFLTVLFRVSAGHFHRAGLSSVDRGHPTPDAAVKLGGGFDVTFAR